MQIKCLHIKKIGKNQETPLFIWASSGPLDTSTTFSKTSAMLLKYQCHSDGNRFVRVAATPDGVQGSVDNQRPAAFPGQLREHLQKKKKRVLILYFMLLLSKQQQYKIYKTNHI